jgi:hypothetical protein
MLPLGSHPHTRHLAPHLVSLLQFLTVLGSGHARPARSKVLRYRAIGSEEALRVSWGCEPLHAPLPLARGLMGVLRTVVEVAVLAMFHPGSLSRFAAP